jgi:hypothetical protein
MIVADRQRDEKVLTVAAAMLGYVLPTTEASRVLLDVRRDYEGTWLALVAPATAGPNARSDPGELMVIDSIADRWGSSGATGLPSILWALLRTRQSAG